MGRKRGRCLRLASGGPGDMAHRAHLGPPANAWRTPQNSRGPTRLPENACLEAEPYAHPTANQAVRKGMCKQTPHHAKDRRQNGQDEPTGNRTQTQERTRTKNPLPCVRLARSWPSGRGLGHLLQEPAHHVSKHCLPGLLSDLSRLEGRVMLDGPRSCPEEQLDHMPCCRLGEAIR